MAEQFEYSREWTDPEAFPYLSFTKNWENPEDYPTIELDETQVRKDMQSLHDEVKDYLNEKLIPAVIAEDATEEARKSAEEARVAAETARQKAETARNSEEEKRIAAEKVRVSSETARQSNEEIRQAQESDRASAESSRVDAEDERSIAENSRRSMEHFRNFWEPYSKGRKFMPGCKTTWMGSSYLCLQPCKGILPSDTGFWRLVAEKGRDGYVVEGKGLYGFHIDKNGDLILTYEGDTPPDFVINGNGELVATLDDGQTLNIGRVLGTPGSPGKDNLPNVETLAGAEQSIDLAYNVEYRCADALTALTITGFGAPTESGKAALYSIVFTAAADGVTVTLPDTVLWAVAEPVFTAGCTYWITFTELGEKYLAVWVEVPANG